MSRTNRTVFSLPTDVVKGMKNAACFLGVSEAYLIRLSIKRSLEQILLIHRERLDAIARQYVRDSLDTHFKFGKNKGSMKKLLTVEKVLKENLEFLSSSEFNKTLFNSLLASEKRARKSPTDTGVLNFSGDHEDQLMAQTIFTSGITSPKNTPDYSERSYAYLKSQINAEKSAWLALGTLKNKRKTEIKITPKVTIAEIRSELKVLDRAVSLIQKGKQIYREDTVLLQKIGLKIDTITSYKDLNKSHLKFFFQLRREKMKKITSIKITKKSLIRERRLATEDIVWKDPYQLANSLNRELTQEAILDPDRAGDRYRLLFSSTKNS